MTRVQRALRPVAVLVAVVLGVLASALAAIAVRASVPVYQSIAILDIDQPQVVAAAQDPAVLDKLSRLRLKYTGFVETDRIVVPVAAVLGEDPEDVRARLSAAALPLDLLIRLGGTGDTEEEAQRTAAALAAEFAAFVAQEQELDGVPPELRIVVTVVEPSRAATQIAPTTSLVALSALLTGGIIGGLVLATASVTPVRSRPPE